MRMAWMLLPVFTVAAQDRPETVIRTTTRLVEVRVMAEDANGNPVKDLRKEDLQLLDDRKTQTIAFLAPEGGAPAGGATPAARESYASAAEGVRDDYALILVDWLNPRDADRITVHDQVVKLLQNFRPRQRLALYLLAKTPRLLQDFTFEPSEVLQALEGTPLETEDPFEPSPPAKLDPRAKNWETLTVDERMHSFNVKIVQIFESLGKLADGLSRIPGRKSLIWVTNGFPLELDQRAVPGLVKGQTAEPDYREYLEPVIAQLNRANVAVYTVDARGMRSGYGDLETLQQFSARTGGMTISGRNDLDQAMRQALEDSKISYTLGFTLPPNAAPGLHQIQLRTTRKGVKLRYRESYLLDDGR